MWNLSFTRIKETPALSIYVYEMRMQVSLSGVHWNASKNPLTIFLVCKKNNLRPSCRDARPQTSALLRLISGECQLCFWQRLLFFTLFSGRKLFYEYNELDITWITYDVFREEMPHSFYHESFEHATTGLSAHIYL